MEQVGIIIEPVVIVIGSDTDGDRVSFDLFYKHGCASAPADDNSKCSKQ